MRREIVLLFYEWHKMVICLGDTKGLVAITRDMSGKMILLGDTKDTDPDLGATIFCQIRCFSMFLFKKSMTKS